MTQNQSSNAAPTPSLWGHPKGLFYLFFAELWERFSFYGMRALLTLYMTKQLLFSDKMSFGIYAAYMSLVYVTPIIGGFIADQYLGYRKSILLGGIMMALGHFFLTIELPIFFFGSLALIIVGNGFFKPNISSFVGALYPKGDSRRDSGFTIFYLGINVGGAAAPLMCAWFAEQYGWHYGFVLAGIGMLVGLLVFQQGIRKNVFGDKGFEPNLDFFKEKISGLNKGAWIVVLSFLSVPIFALIVRFYEYEHYLVRLATLLIFIFLGRIFMEVSKVEKKRLLVIIYFTTLATLFWAIFEQAGSSLTLFADRNVALIGMNAAQTNSINSGFIVLLAIPFSMLWTFLSRHRINPNSAIKFAIGLFLLGVGFVIFGSSARHANALAQTPMLYLVLGILVFTVGELFLSPIGLSKMTELSPTKYVAFIMGVWFTSSFYGHFFAGKIAQLTAVNTGNVNPFSEGILGNLVSFTTGFNPQDVIHMDTAFQQLYNYVSVFTGFGVVTMGVGVLALLVSPLIKNLMSGIE